FGGPAAAAGAVAGGHVAFMLADVVSAVPLIEAGQVRPIALTSAASATVLDHIPTFAKLGLHESDFDLRFGIFAPAKTPSDIVISLNSLIRAATDYADMHERFKKLGVEITETPGPGELASVHARELARWQRLVKDANLDASQ